MTPNYNKSYEQDETMAVIAKMELQKYENHLPDCTWQDAQIGRELQFWSDPVMKMRAYIFNICIKIDVAQIFGKQIRCCTNDSI